MNPGGAGAGGRPQGSDRDGAGAPKRLRFGSWPSPLDAQVAARGGVRFAGVALSRDRAGGLLVWWSALEEGANAVWVAGADGAARRIDAVRSARSRVNEYGGGAFWTRGEHVFWVEDSDQRVRMLDAGRPAAPAPDGVAEGGGLGAPVVLTPEPPAPRAHRYAAGVVDPTGRWMVLEREVHTGADGRPLGEPVHDLVWVPTDGSMQVSRLASGADFLAAPALSPEGTHLAWLQWDHPHMPWDAAELWAAEVGFAPDGAVGLVGARRVAGGVGSAGGVDGATGRGDRADEVVDGPEGVPGRPVSVCLPAWDPTGRLWWCDDRTDRWVLRRAPEPGIPDEGAGDTGDAFWDGGGEVGEARWVSGGSRYGFISSGRGGYSPGGDGAGSDPGFAVVVAQSRDGLDEAFVVPVAERGRRAGAGPVGGDDVAGLEAGWIDMVVTDGDHVAAVAGSPRRQTAVVLGDVGDADPGSRGRRFGSSPWPLPEASISVPDPVTFRTGVDSLAGPGSPGVSGSQAGPGSHVGPGRRAGRRAQAPVAHGLFYPPALEGFAGTSGELPPLVVRIHGGPTAAARPELSPSVQFWTTRGFAVVEVNYRGSTGYGRAYRDELRGGWGEVEVQDCIAAAEHLASTGRVDPARCVIRGGSAGGFTALEAVCAPATHTGFRFAAATTLYGVTDLMALASDTHKFESRYLDGLVGPLPEAAATYRQRSPASHPERIAAPVLILQGLEDPVVPPAQAEALVEALTEAGIDHEYRTYEGEGHGFRRTATVADALEAELAFYRRVLRI